MKNLVHSHIFLVVKKKTKELLKRQVFVPKGTQHDHTQQIKQ